MKNKLLQRSFYKLSLAVFACQFLGFNAVSQTCQYPLDIHIANDISGSVSSREYLQSKDFVTQLGLTVPLGNGAQESRKGSSYRFDSTGSENKFSFLHGQHMALSS